MTTTEMFKTFLSNMKVDNYDQISLRYGEITSALNKKFRDTESKTDNTLQVGSYGRYTGIKGISDLDMIYIMPSGKWDDYKTDQSKLLTDAKNAIKSRYPTTDVKVDRLVVTVKYKNFHVEVQPAFEQDAEDDKSYFKYPDTYNGGSWKDTKPRHEMDEIKASNDRKNKNLRHLCKMIRAWKNKNGVPMGGLLLDTLAYNYLESTTYYDDKSYTYYDWLVRDFFEYLKNRPKQKYYMAPGSNQQVKVRKQFQKKAKQAYEDSLKAIEAGDGAKAHNKWKEIFGREFPKDDTEVVENFTVHWRNTEEFIEDQYPVDIRYSLKIDCTVTQTGFRPDSLLNMIINGVRLKPNKDLEFKVKSIDDIPEPYTIKWKILNKGTEAQRRDCVRGRILNDKGSMLKKESSDFRGDHEVECYVVHNGYVVARDLILVPIQRG
ncbi:hypothetical protein LNTAR_25405 [Lentisphaera araneosa HTCC2155]|uniref:Adenylyl/Guanylyl and SMODS C-terminal sensor domain-containing protein n=1 Tax=Lentisphaera araneosa HTCC2155 TaxID=313628 RepID=A6DSC3_9BACT|nr:nucleotidyltransferase [Lentisphaera araneosa]EDM25468.1 hypothetical protein LNTAR_25405 [Lentisphaera araneosa HTCC2155]